MKSKIKKILLCFCFFVLCVAVWNTFLKEAYQYKGVFFSGGFDDMAVCPDHKYLLGINNGEHFITVLDINTGHLIAKLSGPDESDFNTLRGVLCDEDRGHILTSNASTKKIGVFNIAKLTFIQSIPISEAYGHMALDKKSNRIFAVMLEDASLAPPGRGIRVIDASTLQPIGDVIRMEKSSDGDAHENTMFAYDVAINKQQDRLLVADYGNARFDSISLTPSDHFQPIEMWGLPKGFYDYGHYRYFHNNARSVAVDELTGRVLIAEDRETQAIRVFDSYGFLESWKGRNIDDPQKIVISDGDIFVADVDRRTGQRLVNRFKPIDITSKQMLTLHSRKE